ncbi:MAG: acyl-CoA dehydrogenase [Rhodocyclaceae bacterium]|nr:MAG: acyl-CoA dehydrogenase [Rhodocyclaceae bacterium]
MNTTIESGLANQLIPTEAELIQRAKNMIPTLIARADACEKARMVPPETVKEFEEAGFFNIVRPKALGGYEMSPHVFYKVLHEIGRGCGSSAWVLMVIGIHNWEMALFPEQASQDLWGKDPNAKTSSSYHPWGKVERVEGGYLMNGTWRFSSGCDHCTWAILGGMIFNKETGAVEDNRVMLVPRTDYTISDNWYVFGLAGSGSKDLILENVFVPEHRTHSLLDCFNMVDAEKRNPLYRTSFGNTFSFAVASVMIGIAQGAIDVYIEQMRVRTNTMDGSKTGLSPYVRDRLGHASSKVRGAKARLAAAMAEMEKTIAEGRQIPMMDRANYKWDAGRIGRDAEEAVHLLYKATAARGTMLSNPIQRFLRDALVGSNHITLNADDSAGNAGGVMLGAETTDLVL